MVKKLLLVFLILPSIAFSQTFDLSAYKYVYVNPLYYRDIDNSFGISSAIADAFLSKGFLIANSYKQDNIPADLQANPCLLLTATPVYDDSPVRGIKLKLNIKNCNDETVFSKEITAHATFLIHEAFRKAIKKMTSEIEGISYSFNPALSLRFYENKFAHYTLENSGLTEDSLKRYMDSKNIDAIEGIYKSYQAANDPSVSYKFAIVKKQIGVYHAILIESETPIWNPGEVKMIIENTAINNVFSIKYFMQDKTKIETFATITKSSFKIDFSKQNAKDNPIATFIKIYPFSAQVPSEVASVILPETEFVGSGTSFLITKSGLIATNYHVIEKGTRFSATNNALGKNFELEVVLRDKINDLAILRIKNLDTSFRSLPYRISTRAKAGEHVFTIGYPLDVYMGDNEKTTDGIINSLTGFQDDSRKLQISAPIQPGNSGGPLFDLKGNLIGITTSSLESRTVDIQNVNYAIKASVLQNLNALLPDSEQAQFETSENTADLPLPTLIEKYRSCVFKISVFK